VVNDTAPPADEYWRSSAAATAAERGWPSTGSDSGPAVTSDRPSVPSKVQRPTDEFGGNAASRAVSAAITLASRVLPPSSVGIDWSSMIVTAGLVTGAATALASVARAALSPTDTGAASSAGAATELC